MTATLARVSLDAALSAGLRWLYLTEQSDDALVEHRGARLAAVGRKLRFLPTAADGNPLIVVDADIPRWTAPTADRPPAPLTNDELATITDELADIGVHPGEWHCYTITSTIVLGTPAHPSLRAAVARYANGCPYHHDLVCDAPIKDGGQACPWHTQGHQAAIWPTLTDADLAAAALSGHPDLFTRPEPEENR